MLNFILKIGAETAYLDAKNTYEVSLYLLKLKGVETYFLLNIDGSNSEDLEAMYLDYVNNFLTLQSFADHYNLNINCANNLINYYGKR